MSFLTHLNHNFSYIPTDPKSLSYPIPLILSYKPSINPPLQTPILLLGILNIAHLSLILTTRNSSLFGLLGRSSRTALLGSVICIFVCVFVVRVGGFFFVVEFGGIDFFVVFFAGAFFVIFVVVVFVGGGFGVFGRLALFGS